MTEFIAECSVFPKSKFSRSALFYMKSKVCLKYFVHDCN